MINKISVDNFRCLNDFSISFEEGLNVIVGENDAGKTSLIDVLKILFDEKNVKVEIEDFYNDSEEMLIEVEVDNKTFVKEIKIENDESIIIKHENKIKISKDELLSLKEYLESNFDSLTLDEKKKVLSEPASFFKFPVRSNTNFDNLNTRVIEKINELLTDADEFLILDVTTLPKYPMKFLDGTHFDNVNNFFQEMFFKDTNTKILNETIDSEVTIKEWIEDYLNTYAEGLRTKIEDKGIKDRIKHYLPNCNDIKIIPTPKTNINIDINVKFMKDDENEILFEKMGDGARRRVTMALLEFKGEETNALTYVFDEPDTHLHVKAQMELLDILRGFEDKQVIITTHSPFVMNAVKPQQIKLFSLESGVTKVKSVDEDNVENNLNELGISNMNLFFSRKILIVEGHTEEKFIPFIYNKLFDFSMRGNLVKVIRAEGIDDVPRLSRVLAQFVKPDDVYILMDNDASRKSLNLIEKLVIPPNNIFRIGFKEFEDSFDSKIIFEVGKEIIEGKGCEIGSIWTETAIEGLKSECRSNGKKFSEELFNLSEKCLVRIEKPNFGVGLAKKCNIDDLDEVIVELFSRINN